MITKQVLTLAALGPHAKKEHKLMTQDKKHVALLYSGEHSFNPLMHEVYKGKFKHLLSNDLNNNPMHIIYHPKHEKSALRLKAIYQHLAKKKAEDPSNFEMHDHHHREIGKLLGYHPKDIEHFIKHIRQPSLAETKSIKLKDHSSKVKDFMKEYHETTTHHPLE